MSAFAGAQTLGLLYDGDLFMMVFVFSFFARISCFASWEDFCPPLSPPPGPGIRRTGFWLQVMEPLDFRALPGPSGGGRVAHVAGRTGILSSEGEILGLGWVGEARGPRGPGKAPAISGHIGHTLSDVPQVPASKPAESPTSQRDANAAVEPQCLSRVTYVDKHK